MAAESHPSHKLMPDDAAKKVQKVYKSYRTRRRLADSAIIAEELWWQAIDFARLNRTTVSFFDSPKAESMTSKWNRVCFNASKVGKGASKVDKALILAFQHWIEAIDPRHRYGHNLHIYYEEWCKSNVGQPFFYWLDVGDGRRVNLDKCSRSLLRKQIVKYLGPLERENYEYVSVEGKIMHKLTGEPFDTTGPENARWIFVMSTTKKLYAGRKNKGTFHHSSFLAGGATIAAGRLDAKDGDLKSIWAYSGHYRPTGENLKHFIDFLIEHGVDRDMVKVNCSQSEDCVVENKEIPEKKVAESMRIPEPPPFEPIPAKFKRLHLEKIPVPKKSLKLDVVGLANRRIMSGGLQSPRSKLPQQAILKRMKSKEKVGSYQLGDQISWRWCSGAGPRIGCLADYPLELRSAALDFVNLKPIVTTPSSPLHSVSPLSCDASSMIPSFG